MSALAVFLLPLSPNPSIQVKTLSPCVVDRQVPTLRFILQLLIDLLYEHLTHQS